METRPRNGLWAWLAALAMALIVNPIAVPSGAVAVQSAAGPSAVAPTAAAAKVTPRARLSYRAMLLPNGKLVVRFTSNARTVTVRYQRGGRTRQASLSIKKNRATVTLPKGASQAQARARATRGLRGTAWVRLADRTAPATVRDLTVSQPSSTTALLRWVNPTDKDFVSVSVRRAEGSQAPTSPLRGTVMPLASATSATATDSTARPGTTYTYAVFTRDRAGNTNPNGRAVTLTTKPTAGSETPTGTPTSTPSPTPTGTAPVTGDTRTAAVRGLAWYQANTGVPVGTVLKSSGPINIVTDGTVIDGLEVTGDITFSARHVVIRNTLVHGRILNTRPGTAPGSYYDNGVWDQDILIEHVEVDAPANGRAIVSAWGTTMRFVKLHGYAQGTTVAGYNRIEDSYFYGIRSTNGTHSENILNFGNPNAEAGNIVIARNWLDADDANAHDPVTGATWVSGALCMFGDMAQIKNVTIEGNHLTGGGYLLYAGAVTGKPYPVPYNIVVRNNTFNAKGWGPVYPDPLDATSRAAWTNNTTTTGTAIPAP